MGFYADQVLPRFTDLALRGKPIEQLLEQGQCEPAEDLGDPGLGDPDKRGQLYLGERPRRGDQGPNKRGGARP